MPKAKHKLNVFILILIDVEGGEINRHNWYEEIFYGRRTLGHLYIKKKKVQNLFIRIANE